MDSSFFTWETFGTIAGATAVITIILGILQKVFGDVNIRIRNIVVMLTSIALLEATAYSAGSATWETYVLAAVNGLVVTLAVLRLDDTTVPRLISRSKGEEVSYIER